MAKDLIIKNKVDPRLCRGCKCVLGADTKIAPVRVTSADGSEPEAWCPRCFVYVRSQMEPGRWNAIDALMCMACDHETLGMGGSSCGNCGSRSTILCPPKRAQA